MTIEDVQHEMYLDNLHKSYIESLEKLANSRDINELKENLERFEGEKASIEGWMSSNVDGKNLAKLSQALQEISTIDNIHKILMSERKNSRIYFILGLSLALIGVLISIISILL